MHTTNRAADRLIPRTLTLATTLAALALATLQAGCSLRQAADTARDLGGAADDLAEALTPAGLDVADLGACGADEIGLIAAYVGCATAERARQCGTAGVAPADCAFDVLISEPNVTGCAPPTQISAACAAAVRLDPEPADAEPLDCRAGQQAVAASAAAYADDPYNWLDPAEWSVLGTYAAGSTFGYTARHTADGARTCYVAFRGTDDVDDLLHDLRSVTHTPCGALSGRCGDGFLAAYDEAVASGIFAATLDLVDRGECDALTVVGHSLGGALADIFAAHLEQRDPQTFARGFLAVHTFGQPRVFDGFDGRLADGLHDRVAKTRWVRWGDPVPATPLIDFVHTGTARLASDGFDWASRSTGWTFRAAARNTSGEGFWPLHHRVDAYREAMAACR